MTISIKALIKPIHSFVGMASAAGSAIWTFPTVLGSAVVIAWAAEAAQFLISQGMALAVLAWLQTLPEFAVEAVIAWQAGKVVRAAGIATPEATALVSANLTGSLRLLVGLGWPMIYGTAAYVTRRRGGRLREIVLEREHAVEVVFLLGAIGYFFVVWWKGSLTLIDTGVLMAIYFVYLFFLNKIPPQDTEKIEDADAVPRFILARRPAVRNTLIIGLFVLGGVSLYLVTPAFFESLKALALGLGISTFVFIQWVAPFLSEFPEKVSAFNWARKVKTAPMALMNMVSSNINQWTMLAAMLPIAYSIAVGRHQPILFDDHQRLEILLTLGQSLLGVLLLANMRFSWWEASLLFLLWGTQFAMSGFEVPGDPSLAHNGMSLWLAGVLSTNVLRVEAFAKHCKEGVTILYFAWSAIMTALVLIRRKGGFEAFSIFPALIKEHW